MGETAERLPAAPQEQASWVCQCEESLVQRLEHDFKVTLQQDSKPLCNRAHVCPTLGSPCVQSGVIYTLSLIHI